MIHRRVHVRVRSYIYIYREREICMYVNIYIYIYIYIYIHIYIYTHAHMLLHGPICAYSMKAGVKECMGGTDVRMSILDFIGRSFACLVVDGLILCSRPGQGSESMPVESREVTVR